VSSSFASRDPVPHIRLEPERRDRLFPMWAYYIMYDGCVWEQSDYAYANAANAAEAAEATWPEHIRTMLREEAV